MFYLNLPDTNTLSSRKYVMKDSNTTYRLLIRLKEGKMVQASQLQLNLRKVEQAFYISIFNLSSKWMNNLFPHSDM